MKTIIKGQEKNIKLLKTAIEKNLPALLFGETGTGKTTVVRELAKEHKKLIVRVNLNGQTGVDELVGKYILKNRQTEWVDGVLVDAMRKGSWILFDEVNASSPEVLFVLHSLLDDSRELVLVEKDGEKVRPHKNFRFFASMNPPSVNYGGVKDLNSAFVSRFPILTEWEYPEESIEASIVQDRHAVNTKDALNLIKIASELRGAKRREEIMFTCSTRDLINCALLIESGYSLAEAVEAGIVNKAFDVEERKFIKKVVKNIKIRLPEKIKEMSIFEMIENYPRLISENETLTKDLQGKTRAVDELVERINAVLSPKKPAKSKNHVKK